MLGKCIEFINRIWLAIVWLFSKLNQAIQWTKKYWFFHCMIWLSLHYVFCINAIIFENFIHNVPTVIVNILSIFAANCLIYFFVPIPIMLFIKIIIALIFSFFIFLKTKNFKVNSLFLLHNKYYGTYYIITIICTFIFYSLFNTT